MQFVRYRHLLPVLSHVVSLRIAAVEGDQASIAGVRKVGSRYASLLSGRRHDDGTMWNIV
jgi:hypothetical protein